MSQRRGRRSLAEWGRREAEFRIEVMGLDGAESRAGRCPVRVRNPESARVGQWCSKRAGEGTDHPGVGKCRVHGGEGHLERVIGAWIVAHRLAEHLEVSPWDALITEVKRTAGEVAWLDQKIGEAPDDDALRPGGSHYDWVRHRERQRVWLGRVAKMAVDAGVAGMLVARERAAGEEIARVLNRTLETLVAAGLGDELEAVARTAMRRELLALDSGVDGLGTIEGEVGR